LDLPAIDDRPIDGVSLLNVMLGEESSRSKPIIFQSRGQASVSSNQFKLIRSNPNSSWQLFNLAVDPQELVDRSSDHPDLLNSMIRNYEQWLSSVQKSVKGADYR
jgi:arylsulfatase A-like enzyme